MVGKEQGDMIVHALRWKCPMLGPSLSMALLIAFSELVLGFFPWIVRVAFSVRGSSFWELPRRSLVFVRGLCANRKPSGETVAVYTVQLWLIEDFFAALKFRRLWGPCGVHDLPMTMLQVVQDGLV